MTSTPRCRIGRVKWKNPKLVALPSRHPCAMETMFAEAQASVRKNHILAAGYFFVSMDGKIETEWAESSLADAAQLAGGAALLQADILRYLAKSAKPLA
ncbi:MAG: hypothetical protein Q8K65_06220 [Alphaproteobacteria bacterium]|nr:hypothetical protein [Alphaproteobacteria bacterium]